MKIRLQEKNNAKQLRKKGYSYNEIRRVIPNLSKSTLSSWLKNIELTKKQKERILDKIKNAADKARIKGSWTNKQKSLSRIRKLQDQAKKEYKQLNDNPLFSICISLYWAEGAKTSRHFQFMNSDHNMIRLMLKCLREVFNISDENIRIRIYIHRIYKNENCKEHWSKFTKIPKSRFSKTIYKPTPHIIKKNFNYKGCCRIDIQGSELFWKFQKWQKMLIDSYR